MTSKDLIALCVIGAAVVYSFGHNGNLLLVLATLIWLFD